jgi:hypothetical protein
MATLLKDKFSQKKMNPFTNSRICINRARLKIHGRVNRTALIYPDLLSGLTAHLLFDNGHFCSLSL